MQYAWRMVIPGFQSTLMKNSVNIETLAFTLLRLSIAHATNQTDCAFNVVCGLSSHSISRIFNGRSGIRSVLQLKEKSNTLKERNLNHIFQDFFLTNLYHIQIIEYKEEISLGYTDSKARSYKFSKSRSASANVLGTC